MTHTRWIVPVALGALLLACGGAASKGPARTLEVRATRDDGVQLGAVIVHLDDDPPLTTDADGSLRVDVPAGRGRVRVRVVCPASHRPADTRSVDLRNGAPQSPLRLAFLCRPSQRSVALAVHAPLAEGHAVLVDGEQVGVVGDDATFHGLLERPPGASLRVAVDPGDLLLDGGSTDLTLADRDELVLLTPSVRLPPKPARRPIKRRLSAPEVHVPYPIRRSHG